MKAYLSWLAALLGLVLLGLAVSSSASYVKVSFYFLLVWWIVGSAFFAIPIKIAAKALKVQSRAYWRCWFLSILFVAAVSVLQQAVRSYAAYLLAPCLLGLWAGPLLNTSFIRGYAVVAIHLIAFTVLWLTVPLAPLVVGLDLGTFAQTMRGEPMDRIDKEIEQSEALSEACQPIVNQQNPPVPDLLKRQGKKLRQCIDKTVEDLAETHGLTHHGHGIYRSIDSTVASFFQPGMSLDDAATVLTSAGFHVERPGESSNSGGKDYSCLVGTRQLSFNVDIRIHTCPKSESNLSNSIGDVEGAIHTTRFLP